MYPPSAFRSCAPYSWDGRDWLRGLGLRSYSRSTVGTSTRWDTSACARQFQRTKKLTAATLRFGNNVHPAERLNRGPNSRGSARGWRKVDSKSTSMHALLPAISSVALETRAVHSRQLDLSSRLLRMESQLRRAVHGKAQPQNRNAPPKVVSNVYR